MHYKVWDKITYHFPNFNGVTVDKKGEIRTSFHALMLFGYL